MRSERTAFVGGPLDGRVLPVLCGMTGHPPRTYPVPVPAEDGGEPTVYVYRRVLSPGPQRLRATRWRYEYDPHGAADDGPRWPWRRGRGTAGRARDVNDHGSD